MGIERIKNRLLLPGMVDAHGWSEVAVVYFRAGYAPEDMMDAGPAPWEVREIIEKSTAIKCPTMAMQLAGCKKVQQVLAEPGVLEEFLLGDKRPDTGFGTGRGVLTDADVVRIRETWMGMWPMDHTPAGEEGRKLAMTESERFVLKPQREGGGNNIYRGDIPPKLRELSQTKVKAGTPSAIEQYILMELIKTPEGLYNWLLKGGDMVPRKAEVVSELGIYGAILYLDEKVVLNKKIGSLLRTKGKESDEGGVAIGMSLCLTIRASLTRQVSVRSTVRSWSRRIILASLSLARKFQKSNHTIRSLVSKVYRRTLLGAKGPIDYRAGMYQVHIV
jgi:glutathione synthetase